MRPPEPTSATVPVVVDFDGTLTPVDTLHELVALCALRHPLRFLRALRHLPKSRAAFKSELAEALPHHPEALPWRPEVLNALKDESRPLLLCTASPESLARRAVASLSLFDEVIGSSATHNLRGENKATYLVERFGAKGFDYYGNDYTDLKVWAQARRAVVVSNDVELIARARSVCGDVQVLSPGPRPLWRPLLQALRPHQWVKNLLVFTPLLASHRIHESDLWLASSVGFVMACLLSSAVYVANDLNDLSADRLHPSKRRRPFASGAITTLAALPLIASLAAGGLILGGLQGPAVAFVGALYLAVATAYTFWLKRVVLLDVIVLAALFSLRIYAGAAATAITPSGWLLSFSVSIFLSLALCKRYVELSRLRDTGNTRTSGRGYLLHHAAAVFRLGVALMVGAGVILAFYLQRPNVTELYRRPTLLWIAAGAVSTWGIHIWLRAWRDKLHDDPVLFALRDPLSWLALAAVGAAYLAAS